MAAQVDNTHVVLYLALIELIHYLHQNLELYKCFKITMVEIKRVLPSGFLRSEISGDEVKNCRIFLSKWRPGLLSSWMLCGRDCWIAGPLAWANSKFIKSSFSKIKELTFYYLTGENKLLISDFLRV